VTTPLEPPLVLKAMLTDRNSRSLLIIACAFALWFFNHAHDSHTPQPEVDKVTMNALAGTWTDPKGAKGNHICFKYTKIKDEPGDVLAGLVTAYEKSGDIKDLFGYKDMPFSFGNRSHAPDVVLFLNYQKNQMVMELKATDNDHMRARLLSRNLATQQEDLGPRPLNEAPVDLVREKEAEGNLPKYR
jgi:hypothetical protein